MAYDDNYHTMIEISLLLHNIRSAHNVGSILRTADAAAIAHVYITGYTPRPVDTLGRTQKEITKTALGAENTVAWSYSKDPFALIQRLKKEGWYIVGVEQDNRAVDYRTYVPMQNTLFILGNEVRGISPSLLSRCDTVVEIPMQGSKESLNVSVATGIVLFHYQ